MKLNSKPRPPSRPVERTHEGARAAVLDPFEQLQRTLLTTLLWEDTFYEDGVAIGDRLGQLVLECCKIDGQRVALLASTARNKWNLRHGPLQVICGMVAARSPFVKMAIELCIQRADEPGELLQMLRNNGLTGCFPRQVRKGLQAALRKFNEYQLAKYDRNNAKFKLRDVFRIVRPKPQIIHKLSGLDESQSALWGKVVRRELETPDTWEVGISAAKGNAEATTAEWSRLLSEKKLGGLALLRNLRNMEQAGISRGALQAALLEMKTDRILPFRFVSAYRHAPSLRAPLEVKMLESCTYLPPLTGRTAIVVDVSYSMSSPMSGKSELNRCDAASCLAAIFKAACSDAEVFTFNQITRHVEKHIHGLSLCDEIRGRLGGGTDIDQAVRHAGEAMGRLDRMIVLTDEQSTTSVRFAPAGLNYLVNLAPYKNGVDTGSDWVRISGFSEAVPQYIALAESLARGAT